MGLCFYKSAYGERLDIASGANDFWVNKIAATILKIDFSNRW